MYICDKCGASITEGSRFCPQCGDPVTEADKVILPQNDKQIAVAEISFGYSSSPNYEKAIAICRNITSYKMTGEGKQLQHKIELPVTEVELISNLFDIVGSWKTSTMLINGKNSTKKNLTYHGLGCFRSRQHSHNPNQYCFGEKEYEANIWGCRKLNMPILAWGGWLTYGNVDQSGIWHFDKDRIKNQLEVGIKENELCPVLNRKNITDTLNKLPDTIDPRQNGNWEYDTRTEKIDGKFQNIAIGIKPATTKMTGYVIGSFQPDWNFEQPEYEYKEQIVQLNFDNKNMHKNKPMSIPMKALLIVLFLFCILSLFKTCH